MLDTAYSHWRDVVLARAEVIVALDYPRYVSLARLLRRTARRVVTGERTCNGNRETLRLVLSSESIIRWHFRSFSGKRAWIAEWLADPAAPPVVWLTSPRQSDAWLSDLEGQARLAS